MLSAIGHAVPVNPPRPSKQVTHYVEFEYPGGVEQVTERVPCYGLGEAELVRRSNKRIGMLNVRIVPRGGR
jgi:hypothetical protein